MQFQGTCATWTQWAGESDCRASIASCYFYLSNQQGNSNSLWWGHSHRHGCSHRVHYSSGRKSHPKKGLEDGRQKSILVIKPHHQMVHSFGWLAVFAFNHSIIISSQHKHLGNNLISSIVRWWNSLPQIATIVTYLGGGCFVFFKLVAISTTFNL